MRFRFFALVLASLAVAPAPRASAWVSAGHAIIADIATAHLTPAARIEVMKLLALEGHTALDQVSSWADEVGAQHPETTPWHSVKIPLKASGYDAARDCRGGNCAVAKIVAFEQVLADKSAAPQQRLEALKWLINLVGDIHQPMKNEDNGDGSGAAVKQDFFAGPSDLQAIWDGGVVVQAFALQLGPGDTFDHGLLAADSQQLDGMITPQDRSGWAPPGTTRSLEQAAIGWANESHGLARTVAYTNLPTNKIDDWATGYQKIAWPVVQVQLERAGVRLAEVLNEALG